MKYTQRPVTRRAALSITLGAALVTLSACKSSNDELAQQAGSNQGYISGDGVVTQLGEGDRGKPLDLEFTDLAGKKHSLAEYRPKAVVINLWYAACPPCRKEAPDLVEVSQKFKKDVVFLGVNVRDQAPAAKSFIDTFKVPYTNMIDTDGAMVSLLSSILPPQATPSTVVLDAQGRAAARIVGASESSTLRGVIEDVLKG
ncbi:TlpA family protein disulfide reductase [Brevibacterium sp. 50QC2O2]|uniref:TlpA family protein disulfide reductase n=1 Tax=Brevibacterium TaxID=1696 RepID=UPI00211C3E47|nr:MULTISPECIES: TlpA disulfide reductase family protein [unclassified Brevibacterium]MCQ9368238.1 TlpA family protein disulfide reductase [Brevibacterium sp. 91QC2O2]MCQ9385576.1 TlpA family protein disulfide reductase [Brevibacterium sp. 68QC2CO]MCQ9389211.1 TlpA family protein disulfide reductase [Brevibacterium sp. 50QC2O2]